MVMDHRHEECCDEICVHQGLVKKVIETMPEQEDLDDIADLFKVFGDSTRVKILYTLMKSELCVCDIAEVLGMTQSAISHQLKSLKQAKLIKNRRDGKQILYSLDDDHVHSMLELAMGHLKED